MIRLKKSFFVLLSVLTLATPIQACAKTVTYAPNSVEAQILKGINEQRRDAGLVELKYDPDMENGAQIRVEEASRKWSHVRPNGLQYYTADSEHIYGENLAKDQTSVNEIITDWMNSPAHADNILYEDFRTCAIGVIKSDKGYYCVALEFGY